MSLEHTHLTTIGKVIVMVFVVFKDDIVEEALEVEGLLSTYDVKDFVLFDKWELFSRNGCAEHADGITSLAVVDCFVGVARGAVRP